MSVASASHRSYTSREHISVPDRSCARHVIIFALREFGPQKDEFDRRCGATTATPVEGAPPRLNPNMKAPTLVDGDSI